MRKLYLWLIAFCLLFVQLAVKAQCLSGDCENGIGIFKKGYVTYEGSFKNGLPNGKGFFRGLIGSDKNYQDDSVLVTGIFLDGFVMEGKLKILGRFKVDEYARTGTRKLGGSWIIPIDFKAEEKNLPIKIEVTKETTVNRKTTKTKHTEYRYVGLDRDFTWLGKLKNGKMDGAGELEIDGNYKVLTLNFKEGLPIGEAKVYLWSDPYNRSRLNQLIIKDGLIIEQRIRVKDGILIQNPNRSLYEILYYNILGDANGIFTKQFADSSVYYGEIKDGLSNGFGKTVSQNGNTYEGFYYEGLRQGPGKTVSPSIGMDTGYYFLDKFYKGTSVRNGKAAFNFPLCLSGNCENGVGKARYVVNYNDSTDDIFEGNFVNGLPAGYGEWNYKKGNYHFTKKGNFVLGALNGYAAIKTNSGIIRELKGKFSNDTLISGTIFYNDGSSFESERIESVTVFGITDKKKFGGRGIYRSGKGTKLTGEFNSLMDFMNGSYENAAGIVFPQFGSRNDPYLYLRLPNWYYPDQIDGYVNNIMTRLKIDAAQQEKDAIAFKLKQERDRKFSENYNNPNNFENTSGYHSCNACNGKGFFKESHTIDGNYVKKYYDSKGNPQEVMIERTGRTYNFKVKCSACNGAGKLYVTSKKYNGPDY